ERFRDGGDLRFDDLPRLLGGAVAEGDVPLNSHQPQPIVGDVEEPRFDFAAWSGWCHGRGSGRHAASRRAVGTRQPGPQSPDGDGREDAHGAHEQRQAPFARRSPSDQVVVHWVPFDPSASRNFRTASYTAWTTVFWNSAPDICFSWSSFD